MDRRHVLAALSGAAVPLTLLTFSRTARAQMTAGMASPADVVGYRAATLQVGSLSLQTSELALQRAANPFVRQFAGFERDEQLTIA